MSNFIRNLRKIHIPFFSSMQLFFDLGTDITRIAIKDKGIVLKEPTFLGYNTRIREYIFFGQEAKTIVGKTPDFIKIVRPIVNGIMSDFDAQVAILAKFIDKAVTPYLSQYKLIKPTYQAMASVPAIATEIEQKAVEEALIKIGCTNVLLVEKSLATAAGCGFDIFSHKPRFIIDMGAGLIDLAIVSGGGVVVQKTLKNAGDHMNKLIGNYMYLKHGIVLGERTCEDLKIDLLTFDEEEKNSVVRGKSLETGLPRSVKMKSGDIKEALLNNINQIIDSTKELIEISPPEVADEVYNHGITLTGSMAKIRGIDKFISRELKIDTYISEYAGDATIQGMMRLDKNPEDVYKLFGQR